MTSVNVTTFWWLISKKGPRGESQSLVGTRASRQEGCGFDSGSDHVEETSVMVSAVCFHGNDNFSP